MFVAVLPSLTGFFFIDRWSGVSSAEHFTGETVGEPGGSKGDNPARSDPSSCDPDR
jgi:hypothetical protein